MSVKHGKGIGLEDLLHGNNREQKPRHPDLLHWIIALSGCAVLLVALWGPSVIMLGTRLHPDVARHVEVHAQWLHTAYDAIVSIARGWLGLTMAGMFYALVRSIIWRRYDVPRLHGSYWSVVLPKQQGGRLPATNTNPDSPHVFWDRLLRLVAAAPRRKKPAYLALELWGNAGGRVQWGMWIPDHLVDQREPLRRLITADRPQARLVAAPDPLLTALDQAMDDTSGDDAGWYASAVLTLATRDYYPLLADGLSLASTVAALRPSADVCASGVSLVVTPAPAVWAKRLDQLVQRWRWVSRYRRRYDQRWKDETDEISIKAQQGHARTCLRVQVIARSQGAAERECQAILQTLTSSRRRYAYGREQGWSVHRRQRGQAQGRTLPAAMRVRAPLHPLPRVLPLFPLA